MAKAAGLGFKLSKPVGNYEPYDVGIDLGERFVRVQVKSSSIAGTAGSPTGRRGYFTVDLRRRSRRPYQRLDFDWLAIYVVPKDVWYIIPAAVATRIYCIRVCPGRRSGKYERYREAWGLIQA
jgi:PD-(D/E)XK endonuclease